jgi:predicted metal-dependent phosphotriesterase family hydrolase
VTFVRTVLGDIPPADLGRTYAHEHLVIDGGRPVELYPDFHLGDVDRAVAELEPARALGLAAVVDAMPASAGRNAGKLATISRRSGVHVVSSTGLHLAKYYAPDGWSETEAASALADRFIADVVEGIDEHDYLGSTVVRTGHGAGIVKVAGSGPRLGERDRLIFEAAAATHVATGCPILTHCDEGHGALEQLRFLADHGVDPRHVTLSHTDKVVDRGYHGQILATGAFVEYDQGFRWRPDAENGTLTLLGWMVEDGHAGQLMLGMDAARQAYWATYGGSPGWAFLLGDFATAMRDRGIDDAVQQALFVTNPARAFAFAAPASRPEPPARP